MIDSLKTKIIEKVLGPGYAKDVICCSEDASDEILSQKPKFVYYTGILSNNATSELEDEDDGADQDAGVDAGADNIDIPQQEDDENDDKESDSEDENIRRWTSSNKIGLITCVSPDTTTINVTISYARYSRIPIDNIHTVRIKANDEFGRVRQIIENLSNRDSVTNWLVNHGITDSFESFFNFNDDDRTFSLNEGSERLFPGAENPDAPVNSIYRVMSQIFANDRDNDNIRFNADIYNNATNLIRILLKGDFYKREPRTKTIEINIDNNDAQPIQINDNDNISLYKKSFEANGRKYVKILLQNEGGRTSPYYYQTEIKIDGPLVSYTDPIETDFDEDATLNEYIYRNVRNYGKGIGCAVKWDENGEWIKTTYTPEAEVKDFSTVIEGYGDVCQLRNISMWSEWDDERIINELNSFVDGYENWHTQQQNNAGDNENTSFKTIINKQANLLARLRQNVEYLSVNREALTCFKLANTAMLIQMVISRDSNFEKNRETVEGNMFNRLDYFQNGEYINTMPNGREPAYRPFQLAFLLMNVRSTFELEDENRTDNVDLIWFPTGGGKTEAYLALTALTIIARRRDPTREDIGVSVIMRYTLRLLTSQQFERASLLICALEFMRRMQREWNLGNIPITIGLWIGSSTTPNSLDDLRQTDSKYRKYIDGITDRNPFPISYCPWCGKRMGPESYGREDGGISCSNDTCCFHASERVQNNLYRFLPIDYIDQMIYRVKPTLLFATVDKFAQLYRNANAANAAGLMNNSPDLIIQDELHLISGPLGSTVGLFETVVEKMAAQNGRTPKIVASTATTRNTEQLIKSLYGQNRNVNIFPPQGVEYTDNYFSHIENAARRTHVGFIPTGSKSSNEMEIGLTAHTILTRIKLMADNMRDQNIDVNDTAIQNFLCNNDELRAEFDNIWSMVMYYNSLKDLGRSKSRVSQEVKSYVNAEKRFYQIPHTLFFLFDHFDNRTQEFTSREESTRIRELLTLAQSKTGITANDNGRLNVESGIDLVFASNMISVGIDISRWNLMLMIGQPRSTSEYIQSSSRIARSNPGLVFNLFNPIRVREYSLFENYTSFHAAYYKYVEPLSATPLNTEMLRLNLWNNIVLCFCRLWQNEDLGNEEKVERILEILQNRFITDEILDEKIRRRITDILIQNNAVNNVQKSLRDIVPNCYTSINDIQY